MFDDGPSAGPPARHADLGARRPVEPDGGVEAARPKDQRTGGELLKDYRDVIAEHIDPDGTHLQKKPDNLQSGGGLGTKLGWTVPGEEGLGMVEVFVGDGWNGFIGAGCCDYGVRVQRRRAVDGIQAQVLEWDGATTCVVRARQRRGGDHRRRAVRQQLARPGVRAWTSRWTTWSGPLPTSG